MLEPIGKINRKGVTWKYHNISREELIKTAAEILIKYGPSSAINIANLLKYDYPEVDTLDLRKLISEPYFQLRNKGWYPNLLNKIFDDLYCNSY